jgi:hypothetical protein
MSMPSNTGTRRINDSIEKGASLNFKIPMQILTLLLAAMYGKR